MKEIKNHRLLAETETIRKGDLYYCILDTPTKMYRVTHTRTSSVGHATPAQWLEYRFFRRKHIRTKTLSPNRIALNSSIAHWNRLATGNSGELENTGPKDCSLCVKYYRNNACVGCPIEDYTGFSGCQGSPYPALWKYGHDKDHPRFQKAAAKFRDWLKKLPVEDED